MLMLSTTLIADPQEVFGRSFMFTRPVYAHLATQQALFHEIVYNKKGPTFGAIQVSGMYQQSRSISKTARYFLINGKNELLVSGNKNTEDLNIRDVRAEWLGLSNTFRGKLSMKPQQRQVNAYFEYNQDLKRLAEDVTFFKNTWLSIAVPISIVENDLRLSQSDVRPSDTLPRDIIEAFKQPAWKFSRIDGKRTEFNVAEIKVSMGRSYISENNFQVAYWSSLIIPVATHQNPKFLFDPVVGNDRHVGIGGAVSFQFPLNRDTTEYALRYFINLEGIFLIKNKQRRTFDLQELEGFTFKVKPWSRFLLFNKKNGPPDLNEPGVNVLTLDALVRSFGVADFSTGWRYKNDWIEFEIGYNIWGHSDEKVELRRPFKTDFGIAGKSEPNDTVAKSASQSTIDQQADNDKKNDKDVFVTIKEGDINLKSAAAGSAINHKIHFALGATHNSAKADGFFGAGVFVDIPQKNGSLRVWGAWAKLGASF